MIGQRHCPFCKTPALSGCAHLAAAVEARDFVRRCVELCQAERQWRALCQARREHLRRSGEWSPEREDYTWLETAFCDEFLTIQAQMLATPKGLSGFTGGAPSPVAAAASPAMRARENLIHVLFNHNEFVTIR